MITPRSWRCNSGVWTGALYERLQDGDQGVHDFGLAVHEECLLDVATRLLEPPGQVAAVGVAGEAVEHIDRGIQVVPLVKDLYSLDPLGELSSQGPLRLIAHDHDCVVGVGDDVPEVVADAACIAHARRRR